MLIPYTNLPIISGGRFQLSSLIRYQNGLAGLALTGIPHITLIPEKKFLGIRHQHLIGILHETSFHGRNLPTETRPGSIYSQRIDTLLTQQFIHTKNS